MESQPAGYPVRSLPCHTHWRRHHLLIDRPHIITHGWRLSLVTQLAWFGLRTCMTLGPWGDDIRLVWGMLHSIPIPTLFPSFVWKLFVWKLPVHLSYGNYSGRLVPRGPDHSVAAPLHPSSIYLACGTLTLRLLSLGGGPSSSSRRGMGWFPIEG